MEDPIGYLFEPRSLVFRAGELDHTLCEPDLIHTGWSIDIPSTVITAPTSCDKTMDNGHRVTEGKVTESAPVRESPVVTPAEVHQDICGRVCDGEVMKGAEETLGRHHRELFQVSHYHHIAVTEADAPDEDIVALEDQGRMEVGQFRH